MFRLLWYCCRRRTYISIIEYTVIDGSYTAIEFHPWNTILYRKQFSDLFMRNTRIFKEHSRYLRNENDQLVLSMYRHGEPEPRNKVNKRWTKRREKETMRILLLNAPCWLNTASYFDIAVSPGGVFRSCPWGFKEAGINGTPRCAYCATGITIRTSMIERIKEDKQ